MLGMHYKKESIQALPTETNLALKPQKRCKENPDFSVTMSNLNSNAAFLDKPEFIAPARGFVKK